jgi:AAA+ superfamily predicted ATPase
MRPAERSTPVERAQLLPEAQSFLDRFEMVVADPEYHNSIGPINMIFAGNDGTGKGETAREAATILARRGFFDMYMPLEVGDQVVYNTAAMTMAAFAEHGPKAPPNKDHRMHHEVYDIKSFKADWRSVVGKVQGVDQDGRISVIFQGFCPKNSIEWNQTAIGLLRTSLRLLDFDALGHAQTEQNTTDGVYGQRVAQIKAFRQFRGTSVIAVDMEHLLHLYNRQMMIPFLRASGGFVIFINHADKILTPGYDPMGKLAFKAMMEEIRYLSSCQSTATILGVSPNGKMLVESCEPGAAALFAFDLKLPDYTPLQLSTIAGHILEGSGFAPLEKTEILRLAELVDACATKSDARKTNAIFSRKLVAKAVQARQIRVGTSIKKHGDKEKGWLDHLENLLSPREPGLPSASGLDVDIATGWLAPPEIKMADFEVAVVSEFGPGPDTAATIKRRTSAEVLSDLDRLVGRASVKKFVHAMSATNVVRNARVKAGLTVDNEPSRHMVFKGNPGTGKTVVAKMVAEILRDLGLLKRGQFVQVSRGDLVAGFLGQTALKTQAVVDSAMGGVLFVDEAYSLVMSRDGGDTYGEEALTIILDQMELNRQDLVVIFAGYDDEMEQLLESNPGLRSRFPNVSHFEDFSEEENSSILESMLRQAGYKPPAPGTDAAVSLRKAVQKATKYGTGNARTMRNLVEELIRNHALRLSRGGAEMLENKQALVQIELDDILAAELPFKKPKKPKQFGL